MIFIMAIKLKNMNVGDFRSFFRMHNPAVRLFPIIPIKHKITELIAIILFIFSKMFSGIIIM